MKSRAVSCRRQHIPRGWLLVGPAFILALAISVFFYFNAVASPIDPPDNPTDPSIDLLAVPVPQPLPLKNIHVPEPPDLMTEYVKDRQAAIRLGKALFWDMQVGSDGEMACASCHFNAGADNRMNNTINPGPDGVFDAVTAANQAVDTGLYPFHQREEPDLQDSDITREFDDMTGSQGVRGSTFVDIEPGVAEEITTPIADPVFQVGGVPVRRVTNRNAPTVINAVFNYDNLWDGSANNIFNGVNPNGAVDKDARVFVQTASGLQAEQVRIRNASLASQAVGPPMNGNEMSATGRTFPKLGKKMLTLQPLAKQMVDPNDSVLGSLASDTGKGLDTTYTEMIQAAFHDKWWSNTTQMVTYDQNGQPSISPRAATLNTNQFTQMESNFSLLFGLAVQMYESTLVSDDSPFDQVMAGTRAFSPIEEAGFALFTGECAVCHGGSEFTTAANSNVNFGTGGVPLLVELMLNTDFTQSPYDDGYFNIGVTKTTDDLARGAEIISLPFSYSRLGKLKAEGKLPPYYDPYVWELPINVNPNLYATVNGAFKAPTLRNIELTGPYFHNGGMATLDQLLQFYTRGGNYPVENAQDLDPLMIPLPELVGHPEMQGSIIAFLHTLTDERVRYEQAPFDHPELILPDRAMAADPSTDETITIPAVGAAGRAVSDPIQPYMVTDYAPVVLNDVFSVPFGAENLVLNVLLNDGDLDGQPIFVEIVDTTSVLGGTVAVGIEGLTVEYTAPLGIAGLDSFTYTVSDGVNTAVGTVNVTVLPDLTNHPPEAAFDQFPVVQYNGVGVAVPVLLNDQDVDGNPFYITDVNVIDTAAGSATIDPVQDQILFTPTPGFTGFADVEYSISDGVEEVTGLATIKVNDWPAAVDDEGPLFTVRAGSSNNKLRVLDNDSDRNPDDILTVIAFETIFKGTANIDPTGTYINYTPNPGATGIERFTYFVGDAFVADSATVTVNIKANTKPTLGNDTFAVMGESTDNVFDVLVNDTDEDGDTLTITNVSPASHGDVVEGAGNILRYTPDPGFYGTDSFFYTVIDGYGGISMGKVTVNVVLPQNIFLPLLKTP